MPVLTPADFHLAGWPAGPDLDRALALAAELENTKGIRDPAYLLKQVERRIPKPDTRVSPNASPAPLAEAIAAEGPEDAANIGNVRRKMAELLICPRIERGAVMPDACPAGNETATIPVGGAIAVKNAIIPAAHSADICCSMLATFFRAPVGRTTAELLDELIATTHFGGGGRHPADRVHHPVLDEDVWHNPFLKGLDDIAAEHMATQGDGNHFAFLGRMRVSPETLAALHAAGHTELASSLSETDQGQEFAVLVTHHGSRGLGARVYEKGQKAAEKHTASVARDIPKSACWLDYGTGEGRDYWDALQYVSRWTKANHRSIHRRFLERLGVEGHAEIGNEHNFVWKRGDFFLHGKGATPAWTDDSGLPLLGLIPLNMASPILLVLGGDNEEFLSFCPHGAGRNRSRMATLKPFKNEDGTLDQERVAQAIAETTAGLDIRWFSGKPDLSESPLGYKPAEQITAQIGRFNLATVIARIEPLGCIMAGEQEAWWKRKEVPTPKQLRQIEHRSERRTKKEDIRGGNWNGESD